MTAPQIRTAERMWRAVFLPDDIAQLEESAEAFPWSAFKGLASAGCFAVPLEKPDGAGLAHPMLATCIVVEEIAYESSSMGGVYDGQCILNARALSFAQPHVRDKVLPGLISGRWPPAAGRPADRTPEVVQPDQPTGQRTAF
jgi:alkylation response protein AidB-like acyl-CoA dehydrogenase